MPRVHNLVMAHIAVQLGQLSHRGQRNSFIQATPNCNHRNTKTTQRAMRLGLAFRQGPPLAR